MAHRNSLRQNLLISLLQRGQVETTSPKAKILKSDMSSLLEEGKTKSEDLNFTKKIHNTLGNSELIKKFSEYVKSEKVGVTIVKIGFRAGDNAEKSRVSLIGMDKKKKATEKKVEGKKVKKEIKKEDKKKSLDVDKRVDKRLLSNMETELEQDQDFNY